MLNDDRKCLKVYYMHQFRYFCYCYEARFERRWSRVLLWRDSRNSRKLFQLLVIVYWYEHLVKGKLMRRTTSDEVVSFNDWLVMLLNWVFKDVFFWVAMWFAECTYTKLIDVLARNYKRSTWLRHSFILRMHILHI